MKHGFLSVLTPPPPPNTREDAQRNSPQRLLEVEAAPRQPADPACLMLVIVGQYDSPEFLRQSREFYQVPRAPCFRPEVEGHSASSPSSVSHPGGPVSPSLSRCSMSPLCVPGSGQEPRLLLQLTLPLPIPPAQILCRRGWRASFEEIQDVDHFEMVWKLTQRDYVLTQVGLSLRWGQNGSPVTPTREERWGGRGARRSHFPGLFGVQGVGSPMEGIECHTCSLHFTSLGNGPRRRAESGPGRTGGILTGLRVGEAGVSWYQPVRVSAYKRSQLRMGKGG